MDALLFSTLAVAIADIGDKTQLLALVLAARYRRAWPIIAGIVLATLLNHALAAWLGELVGGWLDPRWLRWFVVASFFAVALWALVPDKLDDDGARARATRGSGRVRARHRRSRRASRRHRPPSDGW